MVQADRLEEAGGEGAESQVQAGRERQRLHGQLRPVLDVGTHGRLPGADAYLRRTLPRIFLCGAEPLEQAMNPKRPLPPLLLCAKPLIQTQWPRRSSIVYSPIK